MKKVFITGMSGTGKSTVLGQLGALGYQVVDTDYEGWCRLSGSGAEAEWLLDETRLLSLLNGPLQRPLFVSACCSNQGKFYPHFHHTVLLSAPLQVMLQRVAQRTDNPYGKSSQQREEICRNFQEVQHLLQRGVDLELDTSRLTVEAVVQQLVQLAGYPEPCTA